MKKSLKTKKPAKAKTNATTTNRLYLVANWKANPADLKEANKIFSVLKRADLKKVKNHLVICPPHIYLADLALKHRGSRFKFGAQDLSVSKSSETTGEISGEMLKNLKTEFVIIGHSERRALGENNKVIAQKIRNALKQNFKIILCIGEDVRDINGEYLRFIESQLKESLEGFSKNDIKNFIIAYEPLWAVGKGHNAVLPHDLHQINLFIKKVLVNIFDRKTGLNVPIIYGGSVDDENAKQLVDSGEVSGLLIGRASLNPYVFLKIIKSL